MYSKLPMMTLEIAPKQSIWVLQKKTLTAHSPILSQPHINCCSFLMFKPLVISAVSEATQNEAETEWGHKAW